MRRTLSKLLRDMAILCLVSTWAIAPAQSPPMHHPTPSDQRTAEAQAPHVLAMICLADDGIGNCTAAVGINGQIVPVEAKQTHRGDRMTCVDTGSVVHCVKVVEL